MKLSISFDFAVYSKKRRSSLPSIDLQEVQICFSKNKRRRVQFSPCLFRNQMFAQWCDRIVLSKNMRLFSDSTMFQTFSANSDEIQIIWRVL